MINFSNFKKVPNCNLIVYSILKDTLGDAEYELSEVVENTCEKVLKKVRKIFRHLLVKFKVYKIQKKAIT